MDSINFVGGKEDSTTDTFPSLVYLSARLVYYINLNCMYNLEKTVVDNYNCNCHKYSGCRKINGIRDFCDLCSLSIKHCPYDSEKNFKIEKHLPLVDDFKKHNVEIIVEDYCSKCFDKQLEWFFYSSVFKLKMFINKKSFSWN